MRVAGNVNSLCNSPWLRDAQYFISFRIVGRATRTDCGSDGNSADPSLQTRSSLPYTGPRDVSVVSGPQEPYSGEDAAGSSFFGVSSWLLVAWESVAGAD